MKSFRLIIYLLAIVICIGCGRKGTVKEFNIIPEPSFINVHHGTFTFSKSTRLSFPKQGQNDQLVRYITTNLRQLRYHLIVTGEERDNCIVFRLYDSINPQLGDEGYLIEVRPKGIYISANSDAGLFYGYQTFIQMLPADIAAVRYSKIDIPLCTILDAPTYSWRGSMLDVSRHFFSVNEIKQHLDLMAHYKFNKFHWHLTDDHGWRIQIEKYPNLNEIGSYRVDRNDVPWGEAEPPQPNEAPDYGGYYTKEEIASIIDYAAQRHIDVIPEIEFPGHCAAVLAAYPHLACPNDTIQHQVQIGPCWPPRATLCAGNDSVITFLFDILDEIIPLFPYEYIYIGGSNSMKDNWERCPKCRQRMARQHIANKEQLQNWMVDQVADHLHAKGRRIIGWDNIAQNSRQRDAIVLSTQSYKSGSMAARDGHLVIMAPAEYCNLDYVQANAIYQPAAVPNELTLYKAYQFTPTPSTLRGVAAERIVGSQANLWTEYTNTYDAAQYMLLPRLQALSESMWSQPENRSWDKFRHKIVWHKQRMAALGLRYCEGSFRPLFHATMEKDGKYTVTLSSEVEGTQLFYAIDADPTDVNEGNLYTAPLRVAPGHRISVASYYADTLREEVYHYELKAR